jgi:hypothetical protein
MVHAQDGMIADSFDSRTLANMEVALERACKALASAEKSTRLGGTLAVAF